MYLLEHLLKKTIEAKGIEKKVKSWKEVKCCDKDWTRFNARVHLTIEQEFFFLSLSCFAYSHLMFYLVSCKRKPYLSRAVRNSKKSSWPVTGFRNRGPLKDLNVSKLIVHESKWFPWSSRINLIPFRIFRGSLFYKPATSKKLFCCFLALVHGGVL